MKEARCTGIQSPMVLASTATLRSASHSTRSAQFSRKRRYQRTARPIHFVWKAVAAERRSRTGVEAASIGSAAIERASLPIAARLRELLPITTITPHAETFRWGTETQRTLHQHDPMEPDQLNVIVPILLVEGQNRGVSQAVGPIEGSIDEQRDGDHLAMPVAEVTICRRVAPVPSRCSRSNPAKGLVRRKRLALLGSGRIGSQGKDSAH